MCFEFNYLVLWLCADKPSFMSDLESLSGPSLLTTGGSVDSVNLGASVSLLDDHLHPLGNVVFSLC
jgi:hypothetical protein